MKYFFLFLLIFLIAHENVEANCTGYCEGEKLIQKKEDIPDKLRVTIEKKKKKIPVIWEKKAARAKGTRCDIFQNFHLKKKFLENNSQNQLLLSIYDIQLCLPCPKRIRGQLYPTPEKYENTTGFCSLPEFRYGIIYNEGIKMEIQFDPFNFFNKFRKAMEPSTFIIGRDKIGDINKDVIKSKTDIFGEALIFPISPKKDISFFSVIPSETNNKEWFYFQTTYKTPLKLKVTKILDWGYLDRDDPNAQEMINFIENFVFNLQQKQSIYFDSKSNNYKELYKLIPSFKDLEVFNNELEVIENYHGYKEYITLKFIKSFMK